MKKKALESYMLLFLLASFAVYLIVEEINSVRSWASKGLRTERRHPKRALQLSSGQL